MRFPMLVMIALVVVIGLATPAAAQTPTLTVNAPTDGAVIQGSEVTIEFGVSGFSLVPSTVPLSEAGKRPEANRPGEGHLHFLLDLQPVIVWERAEPYTLTDVAPGEHQLTVELVNNDHSPLAPPIVRQIRFRTASGQMIPPTGSESLVSSPRYAWLVTLGVLSISLGAGLILRRRRVGRGRSGEAAS